MPTVYKKTSTGYLESQAAELASQFKQAINNGEVFKNVKKIYMRLKKVENKMRSSFPLQNVDNV